MQALKINKSVVSLLKIIMHESASIRLALDWALGWITNELIKG